jgi:hypothetical protein
MLGASLWIVMVPANEAVVFHAIRGEINAVIADAHVADLYAALDPLSHP